MTKQFTRTKLSMALDLDSFLNSQSTSDDDDSDLVPHRTLDEILNDSDSSTPPSSPPPSNFLQRQRSSDLTRPQNDGASESSTDSKSIVLDDKSENSRPVSFARHNSDPIWRVSSSTTRPLPSLFGGVRSNVKPGAALAAAAAASRLMPTPHAAAIKSRRASGAVVKAVDAGESVSYGSDDHDLVSDSSNGDSVGVIGTELTRSGDKLLDVSNGNGHDIQSTAHNDALRTVDNVENTSVAFDDIKDVGGGLEPVELTEKLGFNSGAEAMLIADASISDSVAEEDENVGNNLKISDRMDFDSPAGFGMGEKNEEDSSKMPLQESSDLDNTGDDYDGRDDYDGEGGGGDGSSLSDISELVEERIELLESEIISKQMEKKLHKSMMKPLELAEELEKKQAYSGLHLEEGAAAQPMRLEGVRRGSTMLGYFHTDAGNAITGIISSQAFMRDHGSPQVLAVHINYIAVGMSTGVIIVVASRYSLQNGDNMDSKMLMLGLQGDRSHAPVTSMCFNQQGDLLLAGYGDGHITVWDVQRASAVKVITGEHTAPVVHTLFLGQDSQVTRQFKAVSGDSKGLVMLHAFSAVPLFNRFTIKTQCLLDGQRTGTVLSASPLLFDESCGSALASHQGNSTTSSSSIGSMMGGVVGGDNGWKLFNEGSSLVEEGVVIFATHQTALVVRLTPTLQVYAQLSKPDGVREGSMPYTAWKCTMASHSSSTESIPGDGTERVSLLAVAWDRKVQVAKLMKSELKVYGKWSLDSAAIGVAWLDDHMLVVLTIAGQLFLFAKDGTVIHQTSFAVYGSRGDDLVAYHTQFINIYGNPEKAYHNSVAVRGASVYILGHTHLIVSRLLPWKERIQVLRSAGDWMGALNMSMTLFDGQAHGVVDLPKSVDAVREAIMPYLVELILSYVDEVFSYISVAFSYQIGKADQEGDSKSDSSSVQSEIKEQLTRVGGVAVEFCVHIRRTDILFDEIFSKFVAVQQKDTFLELLEQYILRDMLGSLPPEIMQALVEHYSSKGWLQRVEQCVLHMDISSLDFNQVVRLCREHGLYGALIYLFNKGLDDFRAPLEELLVVSQNSDKEKAASLGYKMLVYLKYCFSGLSFPPGHGDLPPTRLQSLRAELVQFLLEHSDAQNSQVTSSLLSRRTYLNLYQLLELDTEATLDVLRCAFDGGENLKLDMSSHDVVDRPMDSMQEKNIMAQSQNPLVQNTIDALIQAIEEHTSQADPCASPGDTSVEEWPSEKDVGHLFEFIGYHVACRKAYVSNSVLMQILKYLTLANPSSPSIPTSSKKREKQVLALLDSVSETDWDVTCVLQLCEQAHFHQVCGLIHTIRHQYVAALDCYMKDVDEPVHTFSYINDMLQKLSHDECHVFRSAIMSRIPELVILNRDATFFMVFNNFGLESANILSDLRSHPKSLFLYLKTAVEVYLSGNLNFSYLQKEDDETVSSGRMYRSEVVEAYLEKISDFHKSIRNNPVHVTDDMIELYFELLCQYERNSVLKFLETFDSYRVEHCLRLCQEYRIIDAAAFLLERVGDVGNALLLTLSGLEEKFSELDIAVRRVVSNKALKGSANFDRYTTALKLKEVDNINCILHACIGLCQRNSPRLQLEESEMLWFRLLDSFCGPLMDSHVDKVSNEKSHGGMLAETLVTQDSDEPLLIKWKISRSHKGAHILRKLFSLFIKDIVEGMMGFIHLPAIMSKLLSDNGGQEFGDFKMTILGMLGTYGFERRILDTAKSLIEDDTFYTMNLLKKGSTHGYAPQSVVCCICNCPLAKNSRRIRVFSCGHSSHLDCELLESESSVRDYFSGCPVCMPKKNAQKPKNKAALPNTILANSDSARYQRALGNGMFHAHEDSHENSYGPHQMSRFDILTNLQKDQKQRVVQIENLPQLKLAPPAVYHEKVKKGLHLLTGETSSDLSSTEKQSKNRPIKEIKLKGASLRFPLKTSIFGKEKKR